MNNDKLETWLRSLCAVWSQSGDNIQIPTRELNTLLAENERLRAERDAKQWYPLQDDSQAKDAERYRWIRDNCAVTWKTSKGERTAVHNRMPEAMDAAIDKAMKDD